MTDPDITKCPGCGGVADDGNDREVPPNPYYCKKCDGTFNCTPIDDCFLNRAEVEALLESGKEEFNITTTTYQQFSNAELAAAIDYSQGRLGTSEGGRMFAKHLESLLAIQKERAMK